MLQTIREQASVCREQAIEAFRRFEQATDAPTKLKHLEMAADWDILAQDLEYFVSRAVLEPRKVSLSAGDSGKRASSSARHD